MNVPMRSTAAKVVLAVAVSALPAAAAAGLVRPAIAPAGVFRPVTAAAGFVRPASLMGETVDFHIFFESEETTDTFVVNGKPEIECPGNFDACEFLNAPKLQTIKVGASSITYRYKGPGAQFEGVSPNEFDFEGLNLKGPIAAVGLETDIPGLTESNISFTGNSVQVNMSGLTIPGPRAYFKLSLETHS